MSVVDATGGERAAGEPLAAVLAAAWVAHVAGSYALTGLHCHRHFLEGEFLGVAAIRLTLLLVTALAGAVVVAVGVRAVTGWRRLDANGRRDPNGRQAFSYALAAALSALVLVYLLWSLVPTIFGDTCA
ncbi:MAG: hypothetical protein QOI67_1641 [Gaiellaceae bacterium]|nr:hypothetical protein [Gaiellaceae bacterium]